MILLNKSSNIIEDEKSNIAVIFLFNLGRFSKPITRERCFHLTTSNIKVSGQDSGIRAEENKVQALKLKD